MDFKEIGWKGVVWNILAQDREQWRSLSKAVLNLRVPWWVEGFLSDWEIIDFSKMAMFH
jgi:hypothetical protein